MDVFPRTFRKLRENWKKIVTTIVLIFALFWILIGYFYAGVSNKIDTPIRSYDKVKELDLLVAEFTVEDLDCIEGDFQVVKGWVHVFRRSFFYGFLPFGLGFTITRPGDAFDIYILIYPDLMTVFPAEDFYYSNGNSPRIRFYIDKQEMKGGSISSGFVLRRYSSRLPSPNSKFVIKIDDKSYSYSIRMSEIDKKGFRFYWGVRLGEKDI